jgi:hypothetical protein
MIIEFNFKSCRVFPLWESLTRAGGERDPATNVPFVKLTFRLKWGRGAPERTAECWVEIAFS